jgi:hypothetical protein
MTEKILVSESNSQRFWGIWVSCILVLSFIHMLTLSVDPLVKQDEVQIVDFGRTSLDLDTQWGLSWIISEDLQMFPVAWLGTFLQEKSYKLTSPSHLGARITSLISAIVAATMLLGWLRSRNTPLIVSLLLAIAFFADPIFSGNFRLGRVDGWAFAACLSACWIIRLASARIQSSEPVTRHLVAAGFMTGLAPFFWLNAPLLFPLVLLEFWYLIQTVLKEGQPGQAHKVLGMFGVFCMGAFLAVVIGLIPAMGHWDTYWSSLVTTVEVQSEAGIHSKSFIDLFAVNDPLILVAATIAILIHREWGLIIAFVLSVLVISQTMVYLPRVMYLLPYVMAMIAGVAGTVLADDYRHRFGRPVVNYLIAFLLVWNLGATFLIKPAIAITQSPANNADEILTELRRTIGPGPKRVLVGEWSAYFAGRELGWQQFRYAAVPERGKYLTFLKSMDFIILTQSPLTNFTRSLVDEAGFELQETIVFDIAERKVISLGPLKFNIPRVGYDPMNIYRKKS